MDEGDEPRVVERTPSRPREASEPDPRGGDGVSGPSPGAGNRPTSESSAAELVERQARWLRERDRFEASPAAKG